MNESRPDHDAQFVALLTEVQLPLALYVRSLLPGNSLANDVAQQANAKIWEKRGEFVVGTNFKAWAFSIARFEVLSYRKKSARDARLMFSAELEDAITDELLASHNNVDAMHEALRRCLTLLKTSDRELLLHRYASSDTLAVYADRVGRTVGGLKVTLHRLRNTLLECIRRKLREAEVPG